mmetsp:Transcript_13716/g.44897  ORF Transcript_13716/g.44897 Transcript_13716/m.44897 type:complete len:274 (-) Transcript_13716:9-830(-)
MALRQRDVRRRRVVGRDPVLGARGQGVSRVLPRRGRDSRRRPGGVRPGRLHRRLLRRRDVAVLSASRRSKLALAAGPRSPEMPVLQADPVAPGSRRVPRASRAPFHHRPRGAKVQRARGPRTPRRRLDGRPARRGRRQGGPSSGATSRMQPETSRAVAPRTSPAASLRPGRRRSLDAPIPRRPRTRPRRGRLARRAHDRVQFSHVPRRRNRKLRLVRTAARRRRVPARTRRPRQGPGQRLSETQVAVRRRSQRGDVRRRLDSALGGAWLIRPS